MNTDHCPAVRMIMYVSLVGGYIPQSFMRRLVEVCPSDEYEATLPSGMHILTSLVNGTTDAHVDANPKTREIITNDVGVVFLTTLMRGQNLLLEKKCLMLKKAHFSCSLVDWFIIISR